MFSGVRIQLIITHKYHKVGIKLLRFRIISKKVKKKMVCLNFDVVLKQSVRGAA